MTTDAALWLRASYEECQHDDSIPVRMLDLFLYYEDHCKEANTITQSKDYMAKILPTIFPSVQRTRVYRNGTSYTAFIGIRKVCLTSASYESATVHYDGCGNSVIAVPSFFKKNEKQLFVVTSLNAGVIDMGLSDGTMLERIDGKLVDIPVRNTVVGPEKAVIQLSKSIRVCRGVETTDENAERWTSLIDNATQLRVRAPACQLIVPWLCNGDICSACKKLAKKQTKTESNPENGSGIQCNATDDDFLKTIIQRVMSEDGTQSAASALLKSQVKNNNPDKDPRFRRWDQEVITLCLTIYCRSPQSYSDLQTSGVLTLPSTRLLQYYKNSVYQAPGINPRQLEWMEKEGVSKKVNAFGKRGGLVLDEMSIQDDIQIVRRGDTWCVVGMVDNGKVGNDIQTIIDGKRKVTMATHILQFIFHGFTGFRWPVAYFATDTATAHQLYLNMWNVLDKVEDHGFQVDYVMMDGGSANRALSSMLMGDDGRKLGFSTPNVFDFTRSVSILQDIKHCFKKIRNGVESSKEAHRHSKGRFLFLDGQPILWDHFEAAYDFNSQCGLRIHRKLTKEHIVLTPANKMRNNLAIQVLDADMLYLMKSYQDTLQEPEKIASTIKLLENTSILVDFFMDTNRPVRHKDPRLTELVESLKFFNDWEASATNPTRNLLTKHCRDDLNAAVAGFIKMCTRVLKDGGQIKPGYCNSDIVENFFCQERGIKHGCNTNPTVTQYGPAVNAICLGQTTVSRKCNSSTSAGFFKAKTPGKLLKS